MRKLYENSYFISVVKVVVVLVTIAEITVLFYGKY